MHYNSFTAELLLRSALLGQRSSQFHIDPQSAASCGIALSTRGTFPTASSLPPAFKLVIHTDSQRPATTEETLKMVALDIQKKKEECLRNHQPVFNFQLVYHFDFPPAVSKELYRMHYILRNFGNKDFTVIHLHHLWEGFLEDKNVATSKYGIPDASVVAQELFINHQSASDDEILRGIIETMKKCNGVGKELDYSCEIHWREQLSTTVVATLREAGYTVQLGGRYNTVIFISDEVIYSVMGILYVFRWVEEALQKAFSTNMNPKDFKIECGEPLKPQHVELLKNKFHFEIENADTTAVIRLPQNFAEVLDTSAIVMPEHVADGAYIAYVLTLWNDLCKKLREHYRVCIKLGIPPHQFGVILPIDLPMRIVHVLEEQHFTVMKWEQDIHDHHARVYSYVQLSESHGMTVAATSCPSSDEVHMDGAYMAAQLDKNSRFHKCDTAQLSTIEAILKELMKNEHKSLTSITYDKIFTEKETAFLMAHGWMIISVFNSNQLDQSAICVRTDSSTLSRPPRFAPDAHSTPLVYMTSASNVI